MRILIILIISMSAFSMTHEQRLELLKKKKRYQLILKHFDEERELSKKGISRLGKVLIKDEKLQVFFKYCGYIILKDELIKEHALKENDLKKFLVSFDDRCLIVDIRAK